MFHDADASKMVMAAQFDSNDEDTGSTDAGQALPGSRKEPGDKEGDDFGFPDDKSLDTESGDDDEDIKV